MASQISFRPIERRDFPLIKKWLAAPHVARWWNDPFDSVSLEAKYGPRIDGREPVHVYLIQSEAVPIGWIQWYRWRDFPGHASLLDTRENAAGIDLAIGEIQMTGRGLGPAAIREFARNFVFTNSDIETIVADPSAENLRSVNAFTKAGFSIVRTLQLPGESFQRHVVRTSRTNTEPMAQLLA